MVDNMTNEKFEKWYKEMETSLLEMASKTQDSIDWRVANDFMESHADLEQAFEAGRPKCQKVKTEYCKCDCGKHKENGDY